MSKLLNKYYNLCKENPNVVIQEGDLDGLIEIGNCLDKSISHKSEYKLSDIEWFFVGSIDFKDDVGFSFNWRVNKNKHGNKATAENI